MRYNKYFGIDISALGIGCMRFPKISGGDKIDYEKAEKILDHSLKSGVNYIDTAFVYHDSDSEVFLGKTLGKYDRSSYYIADKMPTWMIKEKGDMAPIFEEQLNRLKTDRIDFYLFHALNEKVWKVCGEVDMYGFFKKLKKQGRIGKIGFSFHDSPEVLEEICSSYKWDFAQLQINYVDWVDQRAKEQYEILRRYDIPCIVMEPLKGGSLAFPGEKAEDMLKKADSTASFASWGMRFIASLPGVMTVLSGMNDISQIDDNIHSLSEMPRLGDSEYKTLEAAADYFRKRHIIPCTACRYCCPECSLEIDIEKIFSLFNKTYALKQNKKEFNKELGKHAESLKKCVSCGKCSLRCPQNINIPEFLNKIGGII